VWLAGVRRVGKTTLARMLGGAEYLNCDLPFVGARHLLAAFERPPRPSVKA